MDATTSLIEKDVTIDGHDYKLQQLGAREGRKIWLKLWQALVAPLKELAAADAYDEKALVGALAAVLEGLDDDTAEQLYEVFGKHTIVRVPQPEGGEKWPQLTGVVFDQHFARRYVQMSHWLAECVLYNFGSFLGDMSLGQMIARVQKAASKRPSPQASTGSSGASSLTSAPQ